MARPKNDGEGNLNNPNTPSHRQHSMITILNTLFLLAYSQFGKGWLGSPLNNNTENTEYEKEKLEDIGLLTLLIYFY